jgi:hypothetical protein
MSISTTATATRATTLTTVDGRFKVGDKIGNAPKNLSPLKLANWKNGFKEIDTSGNDKLELEEICAARDDYVKKAWLGFWANPAHWFDKNAIAEFSKEMNLITAETDKFRPKTIHNPENQPKIICSGENK